MSIPSARPKRAIYCRCLGVAGVLCGLIAFSAEAAQAPTISKTQTKIFTPDPSQPGRELFVGNDFRLPRKNPSPQTKLELYLPAAIQLHVEQFRTCTPPEPHPEHSDRGCRLGGGTLHVAGGKTFLYSLINGPPINGQPTVFVGLRHAVGSASITPAGTPYGSKITMEIPAPSTARHAYQSITFVTSFIQRGFQGKVRNFYFAEQPGACPQGGLQFQTRYTFASRLRLTKTATQPC